jgi:hypothetical protein
MKKIFFLYLLILSSNSYSQCLDSPVTQEEDSLSHLMNLFISLDLVVGPEIYNPDHDANLEYVVFSQDTIFNKSTDRGIVYAAIDETDNKESYYCIGSIRNYIIQDFVIGIIMLKGYSDGREIEVFLPLGFDEVPLPLHSDYDYATYGIDVELYWAYGDGMAN